MTKDNKPIWTIHEVTEVLGLPTPVANAAINGVSIDSRTVGEGDLFFAIKGERFDGHDFVAKALEAGAAFAVVSKSLVNLDTTKLLVVDDVLKAMEKLGIAARKRLEENEKTKVIAVTGSVGKTGTKEALRTTFEASGSVHASVASFNNHWGVPLTLCRTIRDVDFAIYEIGMNHPGEITSLVGFVRPHIAIITTVASVHIEFFESEQEIARAKAEIFSGVEPGGYAVLNLDNLHFEFLKGLADELELNVVTFGETQGADVRLLNHTLAPDSSDVMIELFGQTKRYKIGASGRHVIQNSLAVAAALHLAGADVHAGLDALGSIKAQKGRGARQALDIDGGTFVLLDESYNANPASMRAALSLLKANEPGDGGRRIAVLGDMLELGEDSSRLHADLRHAVESANVDMVFLSGPHMERLFEVLPLTIQKKYASQSGGLKESLLSEVAKGDVVMIKGSLGSRMGPLVEALVEKYSA